MYLNFFRSQVGVAGWSWDRIPVGVHFFAHVQTGPGAHPASCTRGIGSFFFGGKAARAWC
jgi:hypothetical protein